jgi:hypothetical protein
MSENSKTASEREIGGHDAHEGLDRPLYAPPVVDSEEIFERRALACGKCRSGPHMQHACMRLPSVS